MRKICIVIGSRANYSSIKSVMTAIKKHKKLKLQLVLTASSILDRYGKVSDTITNDGFSIDEYIHTIVEGETLLTMAKSTGLGLIELSSSFDRLKPDIVLTVGDRFETMATTLAAAYMNIPLAHTMGGEVSGTIDESIRHAITKFSNIHFPASKDAEDRIIKLGENKNSVFFVGCPRIDLISEIIKNTSKIDHNEIFKKGVGNEFNIEKPFLLVSQHPVTTEYGNGEIQIQTTLESINEVGLPALVLWPNADAGSSDISRGIRKWREKRSSKNMYFVKNLPINLYILLMQKTSCLVGNSSSGIREGCFIGTPTVNIGTRQNKRERGKNVIDTIYDQKEIVDAINYQIKNGKYISEKIYGSGDAGKKIADILANFKNLNTQKTINY